MGGRAGIYVGLILRLCREDKLNQDGGEWFDCCLKMESVHSKYAGVSALLCFDAGFQWHCDRTYFVPFRCWLKRGLMYSSVSSCCSTLGFIRRVRLSYANRVALFSS